MPRGGRYAFRGRQLAYTGIQSYGWVSSFRGGGGLWACHGQVDVGQGYCAFQLRLIWVLAITGLDLKLLSRGSRRESFTGGNQHANTTVYAFPKTRGLMCAAMLLVHTLRRAESIASNFRRVTIYQIPSCPYSTRITN